MPVTLSVIHDDDLSVELTLTGWSPITRATRNALYQVVGTSLPVVVTEVPGPRQFTIRCHTHTFAEYEALDAALSAGSPVQLTVPVDVPLPSVRAVVGDHQAEKIARRGATSYRWSIPLTEVDARTVPALAYATLGALTASATGTRRSVATAAATLGALTAAATGTRKVLATGAAPLGALTATAAGVVTP